MTGMDKISNLAEYAALRNVATYLAQDSPGYLPFQCTFSKNRDGTYSINHQGNSYINLYSLFLEGDQRGLRSAVKSYVDDNNERNTPDCGAIGQCHDIVYKHVTTEFLQYVNSFDCEDEASRGEFINTACSTQNYLLNIYCVLQQWEKLEHCGNYLSMQPYQIKELLFNPRMCTMEFTGQVLMYLGLTAQTAVFA